MWKLQQISLLMKIKNNFLKNLHFFRIFWLLVCQDLSLAFMTLSDSNKSEFVAFTLMYGYIISVSCTPTPACATHNGILSIGPPIKVTPFITLDSRSGLTRTLACWSYQLLRRQFLVQRYLTRTSLWTFVVSYMWRPRSVREVWRKRSPFPSW